MPVSPEARSRVSEPVLSARDAATVIHGEGRVHPHGPPAACSAPGRVAAPSRPSADGPRDGESPLAAPLRTRPRRDAEQLRHGGRRTYVTRALLDSLATELMTRGWSLKSMHRLIVMSAAYRQASHSDGPGRATLPIRRTFCSGGLNRRSRLDGEAIRDSSARRLGPFEQIDRRYHFPRAATRAESAQQQRGRLAGRPKPKIAIAVAFMCS